jgi:uncharacterized protein YjbI with pentapeptide repeats
VPVIRLQQMLVGADLSNTDLRGVDFNGADLRGANLEESDLSEANLAGANLSGANLKGARVENTRFHFGPVETASPAQVHQSPDFASGRHSGAIVENADLSDLRQLSVEGRSYLAAWSGKRSRQTLPGGSKGLPNRLER